MCIKELRLINTNSNNIVVVAILVVLIVLFEINYMWMETHSSPTNVTYLLYPMDFWLFYLKIRLVIILD